jgi:hypothetical protein
VKSPIEVEVVVCLDSEVVSSCSTLLIRTERSCIAVDKSPSSDGAGTKVRHAVFLDPQSIIEVQAEPDLRGN